MRSAILIGVAVASLLLGDAIFNDARVAKAIHRSFVHTMTDWMH